MRKLSDGTIFIQYSKDGKAYDGSFPTFTQFVNWLAEQV